MAAEPLFLGLLAAVGAASIAAIVSFVANSLRREVAKQKVEMQIGKVKIMVEGDISQEQANNIVKAITDSNVLPESNTTDAGVRGR